MNPEKSLDPLTALDLIQPGLVGLELDLLVLPPLNRCFWRLPVRSKIRGAVLAELPVDELCLVSPNIVLQGLVVELEELPLLSSARSLRLRAPGGSNRTATWPLVAEVSKRASSVDPLAGAARARPSTGGVSAVRRAEDHGNGSSCLEVGCWLVSAVEIRGRLRPL